MSERNAGLRLQDIYEEVVAEDAKSGAPSGEADIFPTNFSEASEPEQLSVESNESTGLFSGFAEDHGEQPRHAEDSDVVEVDGQLMTVSELRQAGLRQADYTKKTQEIAELRKEAEQALTLFNALKNDPMNTVQTLWDGLRTGKPLGSGITNSPRGLPAEESPDIEALVEAKIQERLASDPRLQELERERAMGEIDRIFGQIEHDYDVQLSDSDREFILRKAVETDTMDLEMVFTYWKAKADRESRVRANAAANSTSVGYGAEPSIGVRPTPPSTRKYASFREAINESLAEDGMTLSEVVSNL